jgi:hypothetical protein
MRPVASAFLALVRRSWPLPKVVGTFADAERERQPAGICRALLRAFDVAYAEYATAMFWWKDEGSHFLGFCPRSPRRRGSRRSTSLV